MRQAVKENRNMKLKIMKVSHDNVIDTLITITFLIVLCQSIPSFLFANQVASTAMIYIGFFLSALLWILKFGVQKKCVEGSTITFFCIIIVCQFISTIISSNSKLTSVFLGFRFIFLAMLTTDTKLNYKVVRLVYYLFYGYMVYSIFTGSVARELVNTVSQNNITIIGISLLVLLYVASYQNNRQIEILLSVLPMFVAVWAATRIGVLIGVFLIVCQFIFGDASREKKKQRIKMLLGLALISACGLFVFSKTDMWDSFTFQYSYKISHAGSLLDDVRWRIVVEYIDACFSNPIYFLFGASYNNVELIHLFANNPHNMFISLHANFGIVGFVMILFALTKACFCFFKKNKVYLVALIALLLSGFGNICGFPGLYDPLLFYFIIVGCLRRSTGGEYQTESLANVRRKS